jgi:hypothetical protein
MPSLIEKIITFDNGGYGVENPKEECSHSKRISELLSGMSPNSIKE